jgi:hypothetical protein
MKLGPIRNPEIKACLAARRRLCECRSFDYVARCPIGRGGNPRGGFLTQL